jgi:outer membrane protein assembly factor BamD
MMLLSLSGCLFFGHKKPVTVAPTTETEPDKILFERGVAAIEKGRYDIGRLTLQTLINTYPDSEYLSKAKLQIADSFYKQGGTSGLVQAKAEYKDFITFFPNDPDAAEAQMKAGMTHYKLMEKPDRDRTQARNAEEEFRFMLATYPKSQFAPEAQQKLREAQEVLAEGNFEVGRQYFLRKSYRAAISRFNETLAKYPDFSGQDKALFLLGESYERSNNDRVAAETYTKIARYFPLSDYFDKAKDRLSFMNMPVPAPDPKAVELAKLEEENRVHKGMIGHMWGMFRKSPDVSVARTTPSPLPPQKIDSAGKPMPASEPGVGAAGATADISVGPVSTSPSTAKPASGTGAPPPAAETGAPPPAAGTGAPPPAAGTEKEKESGEPTVTPAPSDSTPAVGEDKKSPAPDPNQSSSKKKKKKKNPLRKLIPF